MPGSRRSTARIRRTVDQRRAILHRFHRSGLGPTEFCNQENLSLSSLQRWRREMATEAASPGFIELAPPVEAAPTTGSWSLAVDLPGGLCLRIRCGE